MLRKNYFVFCGLLLLVLLKSVVTSSAQSVSIEQINTDVRPFTDLTLEISVPEQTVLSLQPIPIIIKQSNKTNQPVMGYKGLSFGLSPIRLYAKKSGSNEKIPLMLSALSAYMFFINAQLAPGEGSETKGLITIGLNKYFPESGIYELQAALSNDKGTQLIESNKVTIEIKMPTGANREAYNLIKNSSHQDFFFSGARFDKVKELLETLTVMHPNTPYAKNSAFLLGENYFQRNQYPQALTNLIRLENDGNFFFAEKVKNYLKEIRLSMQTQQTKEEENQ